MSAQHWRQKLASMLSAMALHVKSPWCAIGSWQEHGLEGVSHCQCIGRGCLHFRSRGVPLDQGHRLGHAVPLERGERGRQGGLVDSRLLRIEGFCKLFQNACKIGLALITIPDPVIYARD